MTSFGPDFHVFIIRARLEPREMPSAIPEWRFWVEHHPGGEQRNFRDFVALMDFLGSHLAGLQVPGTSPANSSELRPRGE